MSNISQNVVVLAKNSGSESELLIASVMCSEVDVNEGRHIEYAVEAVAEDDYVG